MSSEGSKKFFKVGVWQGGGPEPGYQWTVLIADPAYRESLKILDADQRAHMADVYKQLALLESPTTCEWIDVKALQGEEFHEVRDRGGILHPLNIRSFFFVDADNRHIVVLSIFQKSNNSTPLSKLVIGRYRLGIYKSMHR